MHQPLDPVPVLTILLNPVHSKKAPYPKRTETFVRALCQDETVLSTRWFPSVMDFAEFALLMGWRERYRCIVHVTPHPTDAPPRPPRRSR